MINLAGQNTPSQIIIVESYSLPYLYSPIFGLLPVVQDFPTKLLCRNDGRLCWKQRPRTNRHDPQILFPPPSLTTGFRTLTDTGSALEFGRYLMFDNDHRGKDGLGRSNLPEEFQGSLVS